MKHITKVWFGVCLAGLALGWVMGSDVGGAFTAENWQRRLLLRVTLAGVAPLLAAVLTLLRAENRRPARLVLIVLVTSVVMATSSGALLDLMERPQQARVVVAKTEVVAAPRYTGGCCTTFRVTLDDGRRLTYDSRVTEQLRPGSYQVTMLRHNGALLSVAGAHGRVMHPTSAIGWLFLGLAIVVAGGAFALAWRAGRRERFVHAADSATGGRAWREGRSSAFTVYFAMRPQTGRVPTLVPTNWFWYAPAKALLDTGTGPLRLDLQHAAFGLPVMAAQRWRREQVEQELRDLGCQRASSQPTGTKAPHASEVWQHSIPKGTPLQVFGKAVGNVLKASGPDRPLLLTDASAENRAHTMGFLAAAAAESVAAYALAGIVAGAFVIVSVYAFLFF